MRRWIYTGDGEWWIDRDPPPAEATSSGESEGGVERVTPWLSGRDVVRLALGSRPDPCDIGALLAQEGFRDRPVATQQSRTRLEVLIDAGRLRAWRRRKARFGGAGAGEGTGGGAAEAQEGDAPPRRPDPPPQPSSPPPARSDAPRRPTATSADMSWYAFMLLDELGDGIPDVLVEMTTPRGTAWKTTGADGSIRIDPAPPGLGFARVSAESLALALQFRARRPRRRSPPPDKAADFERTTPGRLPAVFTFPDARPHRVMVVSRTDVTVFGSDPKWSALAAEPTSRLACRVESDRMGALALCSRGLEEAARVTAAAPAAAAPPSVSGFPVDSASPPALPTDLIAVPLAWPQPGADPVRPWFEGDIDDIHHALYDRAGNRLFDRLGAPLTRTPDPELPPLEAPADAREEALRQAALLAAGLGVDAPSLFDPPGDDDLDAEPLPDQPPPP